MEWLQGVSQWIADFSPALWKTIGIVTGLTLALLATLLVFAKAVQAVIVVTMRRVQLKGYLENLITRLSKGLFSLLNLLEELLDIAATFLRLIVDYFTGRFYSRSQHKLVMVAIVVLSAVSFTTTYQGMEAFVGNALRPTQSQFFRAAITFGIQALLLVGSIAMGKLLAYHTDLEKASGDSKFRAKRVFAMVGLATASCVLFVSIFTSLINITDDLSGKGWWMWLSLLFTVILIAGQMALFALARDHLNDIVRTPRENGEPATAVVSSQKAKIAWSVFLIGTIVTLAIAIGKSLSA